jgi:hypothetical protein
MKTVIVGIREVWVQSVELVVEDHETESDAIQKAESGMGKKIMREYSHTLPASVWSVEEVDDAEVRNSTAPKNNKDPSGTEEG